MWEIWVKSLLQKGFKKWSKVQKIAQSGHTAYDTQVFYVQIADGKNMNVLSKNTYIGGRYKTIKAESFRKLRLWAHLSVLSYLISKKHN